MYNNEELASKLTNICRNADNIMCPMKTDLTCPFGRIPCYTANKELWKIYLGFEGWKEDNLRKEVYI